MKIYKYQISVQAGPQILALVEHAKILKFKMQKSGNIAFWALVNEKSDSCSMRTFIVCDTEHSDIGKKWKYLDTVFSEQYVWHIFEIEDYEFVKISQMWILDQKY